MYTNAANHQLALVSLAYIRITSIISMHILAIDFGTKRVGLAWADTTLGVVLPYGVIEKEGIKLKIKDVSELIRKEKITKVVVGFPVGLDGKENKNTERVKKFVFELQKFVDAEIEYFDERFTSQAADAVGEGVSRDERAAMVILEGYLERKK